VTLSRRFRVGVVGGGIAGLAAATVLVERGAEVVLFETERFLGGRAGSWPDALADGTRFEMERGFHAFFRQYYNLRALLRRVDPDLAMLAPATDYPILGPGGASQSFRDLPRTTPFNLAALTWRTPHLGWRDLLAIDKRAALEMLAYDGEKTYARWDAATAASYLDGLRFPAAARRMLFDVFAHSFFNPEGAMSAGELLMMFHFYFVGNPEGLLFDLCRRPFSRAFFRPLGEYLTARGADLRLGCAARAVSRRGDGFAIASDDGDHPVDAVVLATTVPGLQALAAASPELGAALGPAAALEVTHPFAVLRLWLDRPTAPGRPPFAGTTGVGRLDNISLYHLYEEDSRAWAARTGGAVVELHAYAVPPGTADDALRADLLAGLHAFYPETAAARIVEERFLVRADCPAFAPGGHAARPGVATAIPGVALCGDFVKLPFPSALMERAAASGFLAASHVLAPLGVAAEPIRTVPTRGLLARGRSATRTRHAA
jgi:carotenoid phi-ring synthase / carotenoid chi-ring synthase